MTVTGHAPKVIVVAGMPRSGSTWLFNAARLLLTGAGQDLHSAWIDDYDPDHPAPVHLVKVHRPDAAPQHMDIVLTTFRPIEACLASLRRMGWIKDAPGAMDRAREAQEKYYQFWSERSANETRFADLVTDPGQEIGRIAAVIGLAPDAGRDAQLAQVLKDLRPPESGSYDRTTLLHPQHIAGGADQR